MVILKYASWLKDPIPVTQVINCSVRVTKIIPPWFRTRDSYLETFSYGLLVNQGKIIASYKENLCYETEMTYFHSSHPEDQNVYRYPRQEVYSSLDRDETVRKLETLEEWRKHQFNDEFGLSPAVELTIKLEGEKERKFYRKRIWLKFGATQIAIRRENLAQFLQTSDRRLIDEISKLKLIKRDAWGNVVNN